MRWLNLTQTCALTTKAVEYAALQALREVRCAYEFREACGVRRIPPLFIRRAALFLRLRECRLSIWRAALRGLEAVPPQFAAWILSRMKRSGAWFTGIVSRKTAVSVPSPL